MTTQREAELESALVAQLQSMEWRLSSNGEEKNVLPETLS